MTLQERQNNEAQRLRNVINVYQDALYLSDGEPVTESLLGEHQDAYSLLIEDPKEYFKNIDEEE